jgi:uncharacterized metal-binding protein YceD (DUF177 family)
MPLLVNLRHLVAANVHLQGQLPNQELDIDTCDEAIGLGSAPLEYDLEVQKLEGGLLVQGRLRLELQCQCVRCLTGFQHELVLENWTTLLPLQGEEAVPVVSDCVDLTPFIREDILLEFPQHPLCDPGCGGLPNTCVGKAKNTGSAGQTGQSLPAWDELNKLKF